jgi:hypothetical protein
MSREHSRLSQTLTRTESKERLARHSGGGVARHGPSICEPPAFARPPQVGHRSQCGCGDRPPPARAGPYSRPRQTLLCGMGRSTSFTQHDRPAAPLRSPHREDVLRRLLSPRVRAQQRDGAWPHVEGTVEPTLGPLARHGAGHRLPPPTVATRSGGRCRHARLIPPPDHWPLAACQAPCAPPVACRQGGARRAQAERGRFPARPRRARARPTRRRETAMGGLARSS